MKCLILRLLANADSYFFDIFDAAIAGLLTDSGYQTTVLERTISEDMEMEAQVDGALEALTGLSPDLVFVSYSFDAAIAKKIKESSGSVVVVFGSVHALTNPSVDYVIGEPDPFVCLSLVRELARGPMGEPGELHGVASRSKPKPVLGLHGLSVRKIFSICRLAYENFVRIGPGKQVETRKHIVGNMGCPWRTVGKLDLPADSPLDIWRSGCSFCTRQDYEELDQAELLSLLGLQLDGVLEAFPNIDKLVLIDEAGLSYAGELARLVQSRPMTGTRLLVSGRLDHFARYGRMLEEALEILSGQNTISLYQFGIENFSESVLARYNKGISLNKSLESLKAMTGMADRNPGLEIEQSFGFILFDPWTSLAELHQNLEVLARFDMEPFRGRPEQTRLRLYPEVPLYWKAKEEGLLLEGETADEFGYQSGVPWRFKHREVAGIFETIQKQGRSLSTLELYKIIGPMKSKNGN